MKSSRVHTGLVAVVAALALSIPAPARAHCDTLDGPVVEAARKALDSGQLAPVLAWVQPGDEAEIKGAFERARAVRKAGGDARALADTWFFETLVRVHRAGEGAPYTGLKPAGRKLTPALLAADAAVAKGDATELWNLLNGTIHDGLHERFARVKSQKPPAGDVAAGRAWVAAYVPFVHWVEGIEAAAAGPTGHGEPGEGAHEEHGAPGGHEAHGHEGH